MRQNGPPANGITVERAAVRGWHEQADGLVETGTSVRLLSGKFNCTYDSVHAAYWLNQISDYLV